MFDEGAFHLAYRLRRPVDQGRGYANVVASSTDGITFETVATVWARTFDCASLERPALIRRPDGGWRLYVSCSTPGSKHWWVEAVDTPPGGTPADLQNGRRTVVLPGSDVSAWKDVVVSRRRIDLADVGLRASARPRRRRGGPDAVGVSDQQRRARLEPGTHRAGSDCAVLGSAAERGSPARSNTMGSGSPVTTAARRPRRTGSSEPVSRSARLRTTSSPWPARSTADGQTLRYLSVARLADGLRLYFETGRDDGANELRTMLPADLTDSVSRGPRNGHRCHDSPRRRRAYGRELPCGRRRQLMTRPRPTGPRGIHHRQQIGRHS